MCNFILQTNNIPHANNVPPIKDAPSILEDGMSEISFDDESYDMEAVTVPVTICLAIMVG